jgi:hypothetical protein
MTPPAGPPVFLLGFSAVLAVAAIAVSLFAVWRTRALVELADERARARLEQLQAVTAVLQRALDGQAAQLEDLQKHTAPATYAAIPRAGLNLSKRSQVLRMHRKGDPPDRIAAALEVPRQEVDLLIKVHRIVIGNL